MDARIDVELTEPRPARRIATVTVHHTAKLNILTSALMVSLAEAFEQLAGDEGLAVVILTGAGERAFIGGANIDEMAELNAGSARAFILQIHRICDAIRNCPVPVIARMQGYTLGAGLEIAAACDIRIAAEGSQFGMPEVKIGIPSVVEAALLPMLIGWGRTRELLMFGQIIPAEKALAWGLVERVVPAADLPGEVSRYADALLEAGPKAIRIQKKLILQWEKQPPAEAIQSGVEAFVSAWDSTEPRERMQAFLRSKRRG